MPFAVSSNTIQNTGRAEITLTDELDFEIRSVYRFIVSSHYIYYYYYYVTFLHPKIRATEIIGGQSDRRGLAEVVVNVINENDNSPEFDRDLYTAELPENSVSGFIVLVSSNLAEGMVDQ